MDGRTRIAGRLIAISGLLAGALTGAATLVVAGSAVATRGDTAEVVIEATHVPPLLTAAGEQTELRYDAYCIDPEADETDPPCHLDGTVFIRTGASGPFRELPLSVESDTRQFVARVPDQIRSWSKGFTYYAVFAAASSDATETLPAGGASAPHQSLPLGSPVDVDLGRHAFGNSARASRRVVEALWGDGRNDAALEEGRNLSPIGASAFDVDESGTVVLLDQAHRRLLRWRKGAQAPARVPLAIAGTLADAMLSPDGSLYVLESVSAPGRTPLVRRFDSYGRALAQTETAERNPSQIVNGPSGPLVLQHPSGQWMPVAAAGDPVGPEEQRRRGRSARALPRGGEIVVLRVGNEIRVARVNAAGVQRSWRISSETALAEVQLAEPFGRDVVVVARVYTDESDEFVVLVLGAKGLVQRISLDAADWAETAPLGRFRLAGTSLYQLGSTSAGAFVDRFDLEVR